MDAERADYINGSTVEEYYWNGKFVVYVNNHKVTTDYEATCNDLREGMDCSYA